MASLDWQDVPEPSSPQLTPAAHASFDVWFGTAMVLLGIIVGYLIANFIR